MGIEAGHPAAYVASDGRYYENEARSYAAERGFGQVAAKKDSIGVCFCPFGLPFLLKREVPETLLPVR